MLVGGAKLRGNDREYSKSLTENTYLTPQIPDIPHALLLYELVRGSSPLHCALIDLIEAYANGNYKNV